VTIQAQVIDLMKDLVAEFGMGIIFITHDLGVIAQTATGWRDVSRPHRRGGPGARGDPHAPRIPTRRGLINALPKLDDLDAPLTPVPGDIPRRWNARGLRLSHPLPGPKIALGPACRPADEVRSGHARRALPRYREARHERGRLSRIRQAVGALSAGPRCSASRGPEGGGTSRSTSRKGSFFGLVGESGSGKTTLGRAIAAAAPISAGRITVTTMGGDRFDVEPPRPRRGAQGLSPPRAADLSGPLRGAQSRA
jgi:hypothetical protein